MLNERERRETAAVALLFRSDGVSGHCERSAAISALRLLRQEPRSDEQRNTAAVV